MQPSPRASRPRGTARTCTRSPRRTRRSAPSCRLRRSHLVSFRVTTSPPPYAPRPLRYACPRSTAGRPEQPSGFRGSLEDQRHNPGRSAGVDPRFTRARLKPASGRRRERRPVADCGGGHGFELSDITLDGNKANQTATSHGVNFLANTADSNYKGAGELNNVNIRDFRDDGIRAGRLRSNGRLSNVTQWQQRRQRPLLRGLRLDHWRPLRLRRKRSGRHPRQRRQRTGIERCSLGNKNNLYIDIDCGRSTWNNLVCESSTEDLIAINSTMQSRTHSLHGSFGNVGSVPTNNSIYSAFKIVSAAQITILGHFHDATGDATPCLPKYIVDNIASECLVEVGGFNWKTNAYTTRSPRTVSTTSPASRRASSSRVDAVVGRCSCYRIRSNRDDLARRVDARVPEHPPGSQHRPPAAAMEDNGPVRAQREDRIQCRFSGSPSSHFAARQRRRPFGRFDHARHQVVPVAAQPVGKTPWLRARWSSTRPKSSLSPSTGGLQRLLMVTRSLRPTASRPSRCAGGIDNRARFESPLLGAWTGPDMLALCDSPVRKTRCSWRVPASRSSWWYSWRCPADGRHWFARCPRLHSVGIKATYLRRSRLGNRGRGGSAMVEFRRPRARWCWYHNGHRRCPRACASPQRRRPRPADKYVASFAGLVVVALIFATLTSDLQAYIIRDFLLVWIVPAFIGARLAPSLRTTLPIVGAIIGAWSILELVTGLHLFETFGQVSTWQTVQYRGAFARSEASFGTPSR